MKKISIADITLKELSKKRELSLLFREKTAIAGCADRVGTDVIELAPIKNLREDTIIYKTIAQNVANAALSIPVGFTEEEVNNAWECVKDAKNPRLLVELPVSTLQMEYTYHLKAEKMLAKIGELVKYAKTLCDNVEFSALDATRGELDFIIACAKTAEENGADCVTICDDAGISMPEEIAKIVEAVKEAVSIAVYVKVSDAMSMAVASALSVVKAGADGLKCAMAGDGVLSTGKIADAIATCSSRIDAETNLNNTKIHASIDDMLSSIGQASYEDTKVVSDKKKILLDSESTISDVSNAAKILGYDLSDADVGNVYKALMSICEKKDTVAAKELEALIASSAMQAPSTYHLESYTTSSSNVTASMSQVTLKSGEEIISGVSTGDGPIDSAFRAIEQCVGYHYELDDFQVQSVTEGKEALGSAIVKLRNNGKLYAGNGTSTDIVAASIRAYINALNKIVADEVR